MLWEGLPDVWGCREKLLPLLGTMGLLVIPASDHKANKWMDHPTDPWDAGRDEAKSCISSCCAVWFSFKSASRLRDKPQKNGNKQGKQ